MARHLKILEYALGALLRRKGKNAAILVVFTFTIALLSSILFLTGSLKREAQLLLREAPELVVQRMWAGRHDLIPEAYAERISTLAGVGDVRPRHWGYYYDALTEANYTVIARGAAPETLALLRGRMPTAEGECAIGAGVAKVRQVEVDDELILIDSSNLGVIFQVTGVFEDASALLTNDLVVFTAADVVRFFGVPAGMATDIAVEVYNPAEIDTVALKIKRLFPDSRPITRNEILRTYDAVFNWRSGVLLAAFAGALIAFCVLAWDKATGISAEEKQEIGVLKAIGWDTADVLEMKFWEGAALSVTALLLGLIAAYVHVFWWGAGFLGPVLRGWSVLFPEFQPVPRIDPYAVATVAFLTVVPYVVSTVVPAWKTAITDPDTVMRG